MLASRQVHYQLGQADFGRIYVTPITVGEAGSFTPNGVERLAEQRIDCGIPALGQGSLVRIQSPRPLLEFQGNTGVTTQLLRLATSTRLPLLGQGAGRGVRIRSSRHFSSPFHRDSTAMSRLGLAHPHPRPVGFHAVHDRAAIQPSMDLRLISSRCRSTITI